MNSLRGLLVSLALVLINGFALAQSHDIGVVLLHGKEGAPAGLAELASELRSKGFPVSIPEMPWSASRIYDATLSQALLDIDREVGLLRGHGAKRIVVIGQSMGANAALAYAAAREGLAGVAALAPGHTPETQGAAQLVGVDVERAKEMVAAGRFNEKAKFKDFNQGREFTVVATAEVYLSYFDPNGFAVMPKSVVAFREPVPLLVIVGSKERFARGPDYIFDKAPPHPKSRFITTSSEHNSVASSAAKAVVEWLESL